MLDLLGRIIVGLIVLAIAIALWPLTLLLIVVALCGYSRSPKVQCGQMVTEVTCRHCGNFPKDHYHDGWGGHPVCTRKGYQGMFLDPVRTNLVVTETTATGRARNWQFHSYAA